MEKEKHFYKLKKKKKSNPQLLFWSCIWLVNVWF